mgnify:CR=1 FL=1
MMDTYCGEGLTHCCFGPITAQSYRGHYPDFMFDTPRDIRGVARLVGNVLESRRHSDLFPASRQLGSSTRRARRTTRSSKTIRARSD